jgi:hypothetical protein
MTREDIIRMAQECQLIGMRPHLDGIYEEALQRFAALVAAAEREACALLCEETRFPDSYTAIRCAAAIRARNEE